MIHQWIPFNAFLPSMLLLLGNLQINDSLDDQKQFFQMEELLPPRPILYRVYKSSSREISLQIGPFEDQISYSPPSINVTPISVNPL